MSTRQRDRIERQQEWRHAVEADSDGGTLEPANAADTAYLETMKSQTVWEWMKAPLPLDLSLDFCVGLMKYGRLVRTGRVQPWLNAK